MEHIMNQQSDENEVQEMAAQESEIETLVINAEPAESNEV